MSEDAQIAAEIREWMERTMRDTGLDVTTWAKRAGVARTTVARPLKPSYEFVTSSRTLSKLAKAANVSPPDAKRPSDTKVVPLFLPVRHSVQAGHWIEEDAYVQDFPEPPRVAAPDPAYAEHPQWLELVVGDSMNREIPEGGYAHVVDAQDMGYAPRDGDFVVVERRRAGGHLKERTIKQVAVRNGVVELWPRSYNPAWSDPITLRDDLDSSEDVEVEVVGLVIGAYRGMKR